MDKSNYKFPNDICEICGKTLNIWNFEYKGIQYCSMECVQEKELDDLENGEFYQSSKDTLICTIM